MSVLALDLTALGFRQFFTNTFLPGVRFTLTHTGEDWIALNIIIRRTRRFSFRIKILRVAPRARGSPGFDGVQISNDYFETRRFHREHPENLFVRCF